MKNLMDFCIGTPCFWLVGFGIMFGTGTALFGKLDPLSWATTAQSFRQAYPFGHTQFSRRFSVQQAQQSFPVQWLSVQNSAHTAYTPLLFHLLYILSPVTGFGAAAGLHSSDSHDFAGSTAVHMVGGVCALIGAATLGPRIGKYDKDGKPRAILGHNMTAAALGVFILWFCWFGFNGASTVGMDSDTQLKRAGLVFFNTNLAAAVACCATLIFTWILLRQTRCFNDV